MSRKGELIVPFEACAAMLPQVSTRSSQSMDGALLVRIKPVPERQVGVYTEKMLGCYHIDGNAIEGNTLVELLSERDLAEGGAQ
jgi:hypothetical protein